MAGRLILLVPFTLLWVILSGHLGSIILPSPLEVLKVFKDEIFTYSGLLQTLKTLERFFIAYSFSVITGILTGMAAFRWKTLRDILWPVILSLQATPVISWILLALLWFSSGYIPFFILWVFILPIIAINMYEGLSQTDTKLIEMARVYRFSEKNTFFKIYLPSSLPFLRAGMKISANSSLKVLVTAEIIGRLSSGIGSTMNNAWLNIDTASLLGWTIFLVVITHLLECCISLGITRVFRRYL